MRLRLARFFLGLELASLERRIRPAFDHALSLKIDAVRVALEVLA